MAYAKIDIYAPTEKPKQESIWRGPLDIVRSPTDFKFTIALAICFAIWIISGICAICAGNRDIALYSNTLGHIDIYQTMHHIYRNFDESKYYILEFSFISLAIITLYMVLFRWVTRFLVGLTMVLLFAFIVLLFVFAGFFLYHHDMGYDVLTVAIILTIYYVLTLFAFVKAGMNMVCKLMRQSCKAMLFFPSTFFVMIAQFIVQILLISFGGAVFSFLKSIKVQTPDEAANSTLGIPDDAIGNDNETISEHELLLFYAYFPFSPQQLGYVPFYVYLLHFINFVGYIWACLFIMGLGRMILSATFATWYQVEDKSNIPNTTMLKCFMAILNYHTGTIAFAASPLSIFLVCYVVYQQGMDKLKGVYKRPLYVLSWLLAMVKLPFDALAMSVIHGKEFYESVKDSYNLLMKNPIAFLAIDTLSENIIFFGTLLSPILSLFGISLYFYLSNNKSYEVIPTTIVVVFIISFLMSLTLFMVFRAASNTIRFCFLEDSKFSHESEMNLYQIHADDKDTDY